MDKTSRCILWFYLFVKILKMGCCTTDLAEIVYSMKYCPRSSCYGTKPQSPTSPTDMDMKIFLNSVCFCDNQCHHYHDCCPDKATAQELQPTASSQLLECSNFQYSSEDIYMVRSCPSGHKFSKLCSLDDISDEDYDYKLDVPVLSTNTGIWYQNIFCAICHKQEENLASLCLKFNCSEDMNVHKIVNEGIYKPRTLTWYLNPHDKKQLCKLNVTLSNTSGLHMKDYMRRCVPHEHHCAANWTDTEVEKMCHSYAYYVHVKERNEMRKVFRNPHCALCNHIDIREMTCHRRTDKRVNANLPSLSLVLELDWNLDIRTLEQSRCVLPVGIYDPLHKKCMHLEDACNEGFKFQDGECVPDVDYEKRHARDTSNYTGILNASCLVITLNPDEFIVLNDSIQLTLNTSNAVIPQGMYEILSNGFARVCNIFHINYSRDVIKGCLSTICLSLSVICLFIHNAIYCILPKLHNLPAKNLFSLTSSLFLAQLTFLTGIYPHCEIAYELCVTIAIVIHYFFLSSFFWMNVMSIDIWRTFGGKLYSSGSSVSHWKYALYAWLTPAIITSAAVIFDNCDLLPLQFRPNYAIHYMICWFGSPLGLLIFFVLPVFAVILINIVLFGLTIFQLHEIKASVKFIKRKPSVTTQRKETKTSDDQVVIRSAGSISGKRERIRFYLYVKLFTIMGLTWVSGMIAMFAHVEPLWYVFVILNGLQGAFIFFMFDFKPKILALLWERLFSSYFEQPNFIKSLSSSCRQANTARFTGSSQTKSSSLNSGQSFSSERSTISKHPLPENRSSVHKKLDPEEIKT